MDTVETEVTPRKKSPNLGGKRPGAGRKPAPGESFEAARRRKETALADLRQIEVETRRATLLEAEATQREWEGVLRMVRSGVLACVSRIRAKLPHLRQEDLLVIDAELRAALMGLGEDTPQ